MKYPNLTPKDGEFLLDMIGGWDVFQQIKRGTLTLAVKNLDLLVRVATTKVSAITKFVAADHFRQDLSKGAEIRIGALGETFKAVFLGKVEENVPAATLAVHTLNKASRDDHILAELGSRATTTLAYFWELLSKQGSGQRGILLANGYTNIFYILDDKGVCWAVYACWFVRGGAWHVNASKINDPHEWHAGRRVFSGDSVPVTV